jgi:hypothetical protein
MIRDIVRAVLVLVVLAVGCEILAVHRGRREAAPVAYHPPAWQPLPQPPAWQPMQAPAPTQEPGPIRRVARELVDLTEAAIGVIR